ncbi:hypothetical protein J6590_021596 [Homalodisca vitripennis]|nr:hypothetical protein J6590_021596 [Homalodisca vitripennis]
MSNRHFSYSVDESNGTYRLSVSIICCRPGPARVTQRPPQSAGLMQSSEIYYRVHCALRGTVSRGHETGPRYGNIWTIIANKFHRRGGHENGRTDSVICKKCGMILSTDEEYGRGMWQGGEGEEARTRARHYCGHGPVLADWSEVQLWIRRGNEKEGAMVKYTGEREMERFERERRHKDRVFSFQTVTEYMMPSSVLLEPRYQKLGIVQSRAVPP